MKGIGADTLRLKRISISPFLTIIIFCCLLFLETESDEQTAYETLRRELNKLLRRLVDLRYDLNQRDIIITGATDGTIDSKINELIQMMENDYNSLGDRISKHEIRKTIKISPEVSEAVGYLSHFSDGSTHSSDKLLGELDKIKKIYMQQIQQKVNEAISSAPR